MHLKIVNSTDVKYNSASANRGYCLRDRKQKRQYVESNSEGETESDNQSLDPDYSRTCKRKQIRNNGGASRSMQNREARTRINDSGEPRRGRPPTQRGRNLAPSSPQEASTSSGRHIKAAVKSILSWLIDLKKIIEDEKVQYIAKKDGSLNVTKPDEKVVLKEGLIRREGVWCPCCKRVMTVGDFQIHAGKPLNQPYKNIIVTGSNKSLLQYQDDAWSDNAEVERRAFNHIEPQNGAADPSDDTCLICADGGIMICCERCPSTFHLECIGMQSIPKGEWLCPQCVCKCCGSGHGDLHKCLQCERNYHWHCCFDRQELDLNADPPSFCGSSCRKVYRELRKLIGVKHELDEGASWTLLRQMEPGDVHFNDQYKRTKCNSKIAVAWEVLDECFEKNIDRHTQIDIVQSVVYSRGSNLPRINFKGFYTAVLEKGDQILGAASIRVHGTELAEMPFIATRHAHRRTGICKDLYAALESIFLTLGVQRLVIPSVQQLADMWKYKYGFSPIDDDELKQKLACFNILMFPSIIRLEKTILASPLDLN